MKYGSIKKTNLFRKIFFFAIIVVVFFFTFSRNIIEGMRKLTNKQKKYLNRILNSNNTDNEKLRKIKLAFYYANKNKELEFTNLVFNRRINNANKINNLKNKLQSTATPTPLKIMTPKRMTPKRMTPRRMGTKKK